MQLVFTYVFDHGLLLIEFDYQIKQNKPRVERLIESFLERVTGIEPALKAWKALVLPLNHTRSAREL